MQIFSYQSFDEFLKDLLIGGRIYTLLNENKLIFRGQSSLDYKLIPSLLREDGFKKIWNLADLKHEGIQSEFALISGEIQALSYFFKKCDENGLYIPNVEEFSNNYFEKIKLNLLLKQSKWLSTELYELSGLAQHYGIPTRLLDWSTEIFTALYFATIGALKGNFLKDDKLVIYMLNTTYINSFNTPLKLIKPLYYGNPNLSAQKGVFTLWEITKEAIKTGNDEISRNHNIKILNTISDSTPLDILIENSFPSLNILYKIEIPHSESKSIYKYLNILNVNSSKLFPGYAGIVKNMEEDIFLFNSK